jgi:hypothetical protein
MDSQEFMDIIEKRQDKLEEWLDANSKSRSLSKFKKMRKYYEKERDDAKKLGKSLDPDISKKEMLFVYSMMNEYVALSCHDVIAHLYIKRLEKELKNKKYNN